MPVLSQLITADIWCKTWVQQPLGQVFFWDSPSHLGVSLNLPSLLTDNRFCLLCLKFKAMSLLWLLSSASKRFIVPALNARMFLFRYLTQFLAPPVTQLKPVFVITICFLQRRCSTASGPFSLFLLSSYLHQKSELFSLQLLIFPSSTPLKFFFFFFPLDLLLARLLTSLSADQHPWYAHSCTRSSLTLHNGVTRSCSFLSFSTPLHRGKKERAHLQVQAVILR